jgi:hypothetical protein
MGRVILKFENTINSDLTIILDPPCVEYVVKPKQELFLIVEGLNDTTLSNEDIIVRYDINNIINIDMLLYHSIKVSINGKEETIWNGIG